MNSVESVKLNDLEKEIAGIHHLFNPSLINSVTLSTISPVSSAILDVHIL